MMRSVLLLSFLFLAAARGYGAECDVTRSLTVYDAGFALVRESRQVRLDAGENRLVLEDLADGIEPDSLLLTPADETIRLVDLGYEDASLNRQALIARFIGREISIGRGGDGPLEKAVLLGMDGGEPLLGVEGGVLTGFSGRMLFPGPPGDLTGRGRMTARLQSPRPMATSVTLQYLARNIGWESRYIGEVEDGGLRLAGRFVLNNRSSLTGAIAELDFVAGDVHRPAPVPVSGAQTRMLAASDAAMAVEPVGGYHLYRYDGGARLMAASRVMLPFFDRRGVAFTKQYTVRTGIGGGRRDADGEPLAVEMAIGFDNGDRNGTGTPLPAGNLQLYGRSPDGDPVMLGENRLPHLPVGSSARLVFGRSFDILARRVDVDYQRIDRRTTESAFRIEIENHSGRRETIGIEAQLPGDWQIIEESAAHAKKSADTAVWQVGVPAQASTGVSARVRFTY